MTGCLFLCVASPKCQGNTVAFIFYADPKLHVCSTTLTLNHLVRINKHIIDKH